MAKLVLDMEIEPNLINKIKEMAKKRNVNLSEFTANFLIKEAGEVFDKPEETPFILDEGLSDWVKSLTLAKTPLPDFNAKEAYGEHIMRKYGI